MGIIFSEFIIFLRHPFFLKSDALSVKKSVSFIVKSLGLYVLFTLLYIFIVGIMQFGFNLKITDFGSSSKSILNIVLVAPVFEELIFRLPLRKFFKYIFVSFGLLTYALAKDYLPLTLAIALGFVVVFVPYAARFNREIEVRVNSFVYRHYGYLFYFLAFSFGLLHLLNTETFTTDMYLPAFVYVLNPICVGMFFAFVRVKYKNGIFYAIILHAITNAIHFLPTLLFR